MFDFHDIISEHREVDWDREETEPCQRNTPGCAINHNADDGDCEGW
jgi:hypothetical protein